MLVRYFLNQAEPVIGCQADSEFCNVLEEIIEEILSFKKDESMRKKLSQKQLVIFCATSFLPRFNHLFILQVAVHLYRFMNPGDKLSTNFNSSILLYSIVL